MSCPASSRTPIGKLNEVRIGRAEIKRRAKTLGRERGSEYIASLVEDPGCAIDGMYVWQLVQYAPKIADVKAAYVLRAAGVDPWRKVGRMTVRQREAIARQLRRHGSGNEPTVKKQPIGPLGASPEPKLTKVVERVPPRYDGGPICKNCGEHLRRKAKLCGWCLAQQEGS